jgi:hypothetical protein
VTVSADARGLAGGVLAARRRPFAEFSSADDYRIQIAEPGGMKFVRRKLRPGGRGYREETSSG